MIPSLIVPGLQGSGPGHWQRWWQALEPDAVWVEQSDWADPDLERWSARIQAVLRAQSRPVWIVAHSFGVLASVHAAQHLPEKIAGAFLVAPADPEKFGLSARIPRTPLPFPSLLVASSNDPWLKLMNAGYLAGCWGSHLINLGEVGHINPDSGFGPWIEGRSLFQRFVHSHDGLFSGEIPITVRSERSVRHAH